MRLSSPHNFASFMSFVINTIFLTFNTRVKAFLPRGMRRLPSSAFRSKPNIGVYLQSTSAIAVGTGALESSEFAVTLSIASPRDLEEVGALLAVVSCPPDVVFLGGDLGAGKTTLARGFVLCKLGVDDAQAQRHALRVTSPTYLLSNTYFYSDEDSEQEQELHHMDLYRLNASVPNDFQPLQLGRVFDECISLIEWPNRLTNFPELLPSSRHRLDVTILNVPQTNARQVRLVAQPGSTWNERLHTLVSKGLLDDLIMEVAAGH